MLFAFLGCAPGGVCDNWPGHFATLSFCPVVFAFAQTEGGKLVASVSEPGENITGVRYPGSDLTIKRFEYLLEIAPHTKQVWLTYKENYSPAINALEVLRPVASSADVILIEVPITSVENLAADLQARAESEDVGFDAILIMPEPLSQSASGWAEISAFAAEHKLPIAGSAAFEAEQGAIFSYNVNNYETGELAAPSVDKIFKGIPAGTIPVITPEPYLRLNYGTVQELGLTVPEGLLSMADEIIQ